MEAFVDDICSFLMLDARLDVASRRELLEKAIRRSGVLLRELFLLLMQIFSKVVSKDQLPSKTTLDKKRQRSQVLTTKLSSRSWRASSIKCIRLPGSPSRR